MDIRVLYHDKNMPRLNKINIGDWIDLFTIEDVKFTTDNRFNLISLGVSIKVPNGYESLVIPRSSTFKKYTIIQANSIGLIDNKYQGNNDIWKFPGFYLGDNEVFIKKYTRLCQFRIIESQKIDNIIEVEAMSSYDRGGFGSTGD